MTDVRETVNKWIQEASSGGDPDVYSAKRGELRHSCNWQVKMRYKGLVHDIILRDVSDNGLGLVTRYEVGSGETVELRRRPEEPWVRARVMHATGTVGKYKLGALIQYGPDRFKKRSLQGDDAPLLAESLLALARIKIGRDEPTTAESFARECIRIRRDALPNGHWVIAAAESVLGECLYLGGRFDQAEPLLVGAFETIRDTLGVDDARTQEALRRVVNLFDYNGPESRADEFRAMLHTPPEPATAVLPSDDMEGPPSDDVEGAESQ
jgi:hypothetical protein